MLFKIRDGDEVILFRSYLYVLVDLVDKDFWASKL